ncbi:hypothetical protein [Bacillus weihaiensis]|nr:hypothetical protein [Bacillus weihaiensis]
MEKVRLMGKYDKKYAWLRVKRFLHSIVPIAFAFILLLLIHLYI